MKKKHKFRSWRSYSEFAWSVKHKSRYMFEEAVNEFIQTVLATCQDRKRNIPTGRIVWRGQHGHEWEKIKQGTDEFEVPGPYSPPRMRPLTDLAREGRVNPKGIPCLYLATDKETAMAEVRPWLGSYISVGQFKILKDLHVVDCSVKRARKFLIYFQEPNSAKKEEAVWADIDRAFSEPINPDESTADYAPTQVLAEAFRTHGFDGIVYKSLLGKGFNVALFDIEAADLINCFLYEVKSISFDFKQSSNPYFVTKYYGNNKKENA